MSAKSAEDFEIRTRDGRAALRGLFEFPDLDSDELPLLIIVNGGWFMERDGFMGDSRTELDFMYRRIALAARELGFATLRYDNRGVRGNELTMLAPPGGASEFDITRHYIEQCIDNKVRREVTVESNLEDIAQIVELGGSHPRVDPNHTVLLAHSEGGLSAARLIAKRAIEPVGLLLVGAIAESPSSILHWQVVDRYVDEVLSWGADSRVRAEDVDENYANSGFPLVGMPKERLMPPAQGWTRVELERVFEEDYQALRDEALSSPSADPYPRPDETLELVCASYNWWQQWFSDDISLIESLAGFKGSVAFHLGELDSQAPGQREAKIALRAEGLQPRVVVHGGRGHALRSGEPTAGPIDEGAVAALVSDALAMVRGPRPDWTGLVYLEQADN